MNLHHTNGTADWHHIPSAQYTIWQRVAAATHGVITPANVTSIVGFLLVLWGLVLLAQGSPWVGIGLIVVGRLADICDGWLAHATGTKSPVGEMLDATFDKLAVVVVLLALYWLAILPLAVTAIVLAINLGLALIGVIARLLHIKVHPNRAGKLNGVAIWGALPLYAIAPYVNGAIGWWVMAIATGILALSILLACIAAVLYSTTIITQYRARKRSRG